MAFSNPNAPNLADFIAFCQRQGVAPAFLPTDSQYYAWALKFAVDRALHVPLIPGIEYSLACYNLGLHWLISQAEDQAGLGLASLSWSGGLVTATAINPLGLNAGIGFQVLIVGCAPIGFNGAYAATAMSADTFVYEQPTNPGASLATTVGLFNLCLFSGLRAQYGLSSLLMPGVVQSAGDQGTSTSLVVPQFFQDLTLEQLDLIKTPWGRAYVAYAQKAGPTVIGVS